MMPYRYIYVAVPLAVLIAVLWFGFLAVKFKRKEHLIWIVPLALSRFLDFIASFGSFILAKATLASQFSPSSPAMTFVPALMASSALSFIFGLVAIAALVVVIWKSLDQTQAAEDR